MQTTIPPFDYIIYGATLCSNIVVWIIYAKFKKEKNESIKLKEEAYKAHIEVLREKAALMNPSVFKEYRAMEIDTLKEKLKAKEITIVQYESYVEVIKTVIETTNMAFEVINTIGAFHGLEEKFTPITLIEK